MELAHRFTVPTTVAETWEHFNDIATVAECFPGAVVTEAGDESFAGSVKVKLGPIALVYQGSGTFVEKDEENHRFVVEAKGKDKRGNGTAGATVTLSMAEAPSGTAVEVLTDLAVTGKPAQFGRGVMQDVSDKLLGRFVSCLEERLAAPEVSAEPVQEPGAPVGGSHAATVADPVAAPSVGPVTDPPAVSLTVSAGERAGSSTRAGSGARAGDDALDLGGAVLPVLARTYGKQVGLAAVVLAAIWVVIRRLRR